MGNISDLLETFFAIAMLAWPFIFVLAMSVSVGRARGRKYGCWYFGASMTMLCITYIVAMISMVRVWPRPAPLVGLGVFVWTYGIAALFWIIRYDLLRRKPSTHDRA